MTSLSPTCATMSAATFNPDNIWHAFLKKWQEKIHSTKFDMGHVSVEPPFAALILLSPKQ